ncbi:hypothetical protein RO07_07775 [Pandoraea pulmonicola]|uniref:Uncharacterized protein n=1 Tax=Pandoraea pulmonicola TaxID=93221 RepID=A0ABM5RY87_PANPU|nr:hypothetical protein RO07_07775 [Pandoraea pulmonicola]
MIGRTVYVERRYDAERWAVTLLGAPAFGLTFRDRRPVIGNKTAFRDMSLVPLRWELSEAGETQTGVCYG